MRTERTVPGGADGWAVGPARDPAVGPGRQRTTGMPAPLVAVVGVGVRRVAGWRPPGARRCARHGRRALGPADHVTRHPGHARRRRGGADRHVLAVGRSRCRRSCFLAAGRAVALSLDARRRLGRPSHPHGVVSSAPASTWRSTRSSSSSSASYVAGRRLVGAGDRRLPLPASSLATWVAPWLGGAVPPRYWRKGVAALQGIVLTMAIAAVLPRAAAVGVATAALALLAWSFGTQCVELWRLRVAHQTGPAESPATGHSPGGPPGARRRAPLPGPSRSVNARGSTDRPRASRVRGGVATAATLLPLLVAWVVLVAPDDPTDQPLHLVAQGAGRTAPARAASPGASGAMATSGRAGARGGGRGGDPGQAPRHRFHRFAAAPLRPRSPTGPT